VLENKNKGMVWRAQSRPNFVTQNMVCHFIDEINMKFNYIALLVLFAVGKLTAQLPSGSVAPDFIGKDLSGKTWRLYDLLAQNKVVVLEFSATWCPPCWSYHNSKAMQSLYTLYGPKGTNDLVVLFIEGDSKTNTDCLYGLSSCNYKTLGNWTKDVEYPIIDDANIAKLYQISYFPTIFVICPDKNLLEVGQLNTQALRVKTRTCPVLFGEQNAGIFNFSTGTNLYEVCDELTLSPRFNLINIGQKPLKSAEIKLFWNSETVETQKWTGDLPLYAANTIKFSPITLKSAGSLSAKITSINDGAKDADTTNNLIQHKYGIAPQVGNAQKLLLRISTDNFGEELYWELRDESGKVLDYGGNEKIGPDGGGRFLGGPPIGLGTYASNALIRDTLNLPGPGCYSFHMIDSYGDGFCCEWGQGFYRISNLATPANIIISGGDFEAYDNRAFGSQTITSSEETVNSVEKSLFIYPNPAVDKLHLEWFMPNSEEMSIQVLNMSGQQIRMLWNGHLSAGNHELSLDTSTLPPGIYCLYFQEKGKPWTKTFIKQ
jgi:thiol-disulfide isomerase/thioredoxin